jgi:hypothetical protein
MRVVIKLLYQHDEHSTGPPPPCAVLVLQLSHLLTSKHVRQHFASYGPLTSFDWHTDQATGSFLGIVHVGYRTHVEALACATKEDGARFGATSGIAFGLAATAGRDGEDKMRVVLDGDGRKLRAVLKELENRKRRAADEKRRAEREATERQRREAKAARAAQGTPHSQGGADTPVQQSARHGKTGSSTPATRTQHSLPIRPAVPTHGLAHTPAQPAKPLTEDEQRTSLIAAVRMSDQKPLLSADATPKPALVRARAARPGQKEVFVRGMGRGEGFPSGRGRGRGGAYISRGSRYERFGDRDRDHWTRRGRSRSRSRSKSRSPSRASPARRIVDPREEHEAALEELSKNGMPHAQIARTHVVKEDDVVEAFKGFKVDKVRCAHENASMSLCLTFSGS